MSTFRPDAITFLCSKGYDPAQDSPQKFESAWDLLNKKNDDTEKQIGDEKPRLEKLKKENKQTSSAPSLSSTNPYAPLFRPASSDPSPTTTPKTSLAQMLNEPQLRKGAVDSLVREIQGRQDELKRVQHDIDTEEGRKLKKGNTAAGGSDG